MLYDSFSLFGHLNLPFRVSFTCIYSARSNVDQSLNDVRR